jgi:hypothetical protein
VSKKPAAQSPMGGLSVWRDLEKLKHQPVVSAGLNRHLAMLRTWQSQRLARTYSDLLAQPRFRLACEFFLNDIYAARDFTQRDHDIEQMYAFMRRVFPETLIHPLKLTVEVHALTRDLDERLLQVLVDDCGVQDQITEPHYAEAYRRCDNYPERIRQIELVYKIGLELNDIVNQPISGLALTLAKTPARRAGWVELTDFVEHGYTAFRKMRDAQPFLDTIRQREKLILDRIYTEEPEPFSI